jgi:hypothetical protein
MEHFVCVTCGVQYAASQAPPPACPVCEDERQYVPEDGQRWTTLEELGADHRNELREEGELVGVGTEPAIAIGQRALLVPAGERELVMWDCITLFDEQTAAEIERRGRVLAIAISHPHYYSAMVEWAQRLGCPVLLHADDADWVMRPDDSIELWAGETHRVGALELIRLGGHFAGGTVLHWPGGAGGRGALLSGDIVQVIPDRTHVSFMYSYPNLIPLPAATVQRMAGVLARYPFEQIYGAWWGRIVRRDGSEVVRRSAERYARAVA